MAKINRTKEIWHIPKRGSVHQTIYMVYVLSWDKFLGKSWSGGKQEVLGTEMGKAGLTESGKSITHQSIRTLLANVPKYLGFVYLDTSSKPSIIYVTAAGYELIDNHNIASVTKHKNLREYSLSGDLIKTSDVFKKQMTKLIITNPQISKDCQNILVFPFRMTLKLLLELEYLDMEEIGYILFHTKAEDEYPLVLQRIKNFRSMPSEKRNAEIDAYRKTEEGILTLVKAPTAGYYMYLCFSTGLCQRAKAVVNKTKNNKLPAIKLIDKDTTKNLLKKFGESEIYDFKNNSCLWNEYFSNPKRMSPPFDISISMKKDIESLIIIEKESEPIFSDVFFSESRQFIIPFFEGEEYVIILYDLNEGKVKYKDKHNFSRKLRNIVLDISDSDKIHRWNESKVVLKIEEMFSNKYDGFDKEYSTKLKVLRDKLSLNFFDSRRKGGRFEYLFFRLLDMLKEKGIIQEVFWFGKSGKYGINEPAPGGKEGNPDIIFEINDYLFVLELTTLRGIRAQWNSSEASSVPDHICKYKKKFPKKKVIGIFSAPSINAQLQRNITLNAESEGFGVKFEPCIDFAKFLSQAKMEDIINRLTK